jgi:hypothetical protein
MTVSSLFARRGFLFGLASAVLAGFFAALPAAAVPYFAQDLYAITPLPGVADSPKVSSYAGKIGPGGVLVGTGSNQANITAQGLIWRPNAGPALLTPPGYSMSWGVSTDGTQAVGMGLIGNGGQRALLWPSGASTSVIDLQPTNLSDIITSAAFAVSGGQQVGRGVSGTTHLEHAIVWNGAADSAVDLHPATAVSAAAWSEANGTDGIYQVGFVLDHDSSHASLWSGTAASWVDLNPSQFHGVTSSAARAVSGPYQVGSASFELPGQTPPVINHAMIWSGTAASAVDLQSTTLTGLNESIAEGIRGLTVVGYGYNGATVGSNQSPYHALVWADGTPESVFDLQTLLPPSLVSSQAYTVDANGNIFGTATDTSGVSHAVEWSPAVPAPEPSGLLVLAITAIGTLTLRRRGLPGSRT